MSPLPLSVIVPVYNVAPYLSRCLDSILAQTRPVAEIICIDDGSTDGSVDVIRQKTAIDSRVQLIQQENAGPGTARNRGMKVAHGKYVAFLDSDDFYLDEDALAKMVRFADEHALEMTGAKISTFYDGEVTWQRNYYGILGLHYDGRSYDYRSQLQKIIGGFTGFVFSLAMLRKHHIQFPHYLRNEDPVFMVKALYAAGKTAFIDANLYVVRNYPREDRNASERAVTSNVDGAKEIITFAVQHDLSELLYHELDVIEYKYPNRIMKFFNLQILSSLMEINRITTAYAGMKELSILKRIEANVRSAYQKPDEFSEKIKKLLSSGKSFYLYGAGNITHYILNDFQAKGFYHRIKAILVSETEDNPTEMDGVPVLSFTEARELSKDDPIVIAVGYRFMREIIEKLTKAGMKQIITLSDADRMLLQNQFMKFES